MTARRTGPRAKKGSKTASRTQRAQTKAGVRKKISTRKKAPARKKKPSRKNAASPRGTRGASKARVRKKSPRKAASKRKPVRKKSASGSRAARKPAAKQSARGKSARRTAAAAKPGGPRVAGPRGFRIAATRSREIGRIDQAFARASAAVLELSGELRVGDWIAVRGPTTDFTQRVESLRLDDAPVDSAGAGETVGIATRLRTRVGDRVERLDP